MFVWGVFLHLAMCGVVCCIGDGCACTRVFRLGGEQVLVGCVYLRGFEVDDIVDSDDAVDSSSSENHGVTDVLVP